MEAQKPKIALYVQRSFGEKLTATFDFIKGELEAVDEIHHISDVAALSASGTEPERADERYNGSG